jgi:hypothetical protein
LAPHRPVDAKERPESLAQAPLQTHHKQPSCLPGSSQSPRPGLVGRALEPEMERGYLGRVDT